jgi:hypothetical protein
MNALRKPTMLATTQMRIPSPNHTLLYSLPLPRDMPKFRSRAIALA